MTRKMASLRKISKILPIEGADSIEAAVVGGWTVVTRKNEFTEGELAVYLEIDSWVPNHLAPFLSKGKEPREYEGVIGERLRTAKLRGQLSQGLLLKAMPSDNSALSCGGIEFPCVEGYDLSDVLGIQKWEAPIPAQLAGDVNGNFPSFCPKTDQERIQNLTDQLLTWQDNPSFTWEITEKLDGSSMTVFYKNGHFGVCSRNWDLRESESNSLWKVARAYNLEAILKNEGNFAIQGELIGEGIQGNPYKIRGQDFFVYDIFDINAQRYMTPSARQQFTQRNGLNHVPIIANNAVIHESVLDLLVSAEGKSMLGSASTEREGLVFKRDGVNSFKVISNKFLLNLEK